MSRRPRIICSGVPNHILQRSLNRMICFCEKKDFLQYTNWLSEYSLYLKCDIHAYVLMPDHLHLLITPSTADNLSLLMKTLSQLYTQYFNRKYQRSGTLWAGRYKSCFMNENSYILNCYKYIELSPVRENIVEHPKDYEWSSYHHNINGKLGFVQPHSCYLELGNDKNGRQKIYSQILSSELESKIVKKIEVATNGNYVFGSKEFSKEMELKFGTRVTSGTAGRPKTNNKISNSDPSPI